MLRPLNVSLCKVVTTYLQCVCYESNSHKKKAKDEEENLAQNIPEQAKAPLLKVVNYIIQHLNVRNENKENLFLFFRHPTQGLRKTMTFQP